MRRLQLVDAGGIRFIIAKVDDVVAGTLRSVAKFDLSVKSYVVLHIFQLERFVDSAKSCHNLFQVQPIVANHLFVSHLKYADYLLLFEPVVTITMLVYISQGSGDLWKNMCTALSNYRISNKFENDMW